MRRASAAVVALVMRRGQRPAPPAKSDVADAAMRGDMAAVRALIAKKADVNAPQNDGATALHWAVYRGNVEMADLLVRAGANVKAANREGSTPLWLASVNGDAAIIGRAARSGRRRRTRSCRSAARR